MLDVVKAHAKLFWKYDESDIQTIKVKKIDIAKDFRGSFIP